MTNLYVNIGLPLFLILLGWLAGSAAERRHLRSLARREKALEGMVVSDLKTFPAIDPAGKQPAMVMGAAVIATDYLKSFLAGVRKILGGELVSFQSLMSRARREAIVRLLEQARDQGYDGVCNVRMDFVDIGGGASSRRAAVMVAVFATATAYQTNRGMSHE